MSRLLMLVVLVAASDVTHADDELIATVNLRAVMKHLPTERADRLEMMHRVSDADRQAKMMLAAVVALEDQLANEVPTDADGLNAKIARLEFESFRRATSDRLTRAEQEMFAKWMRHASTAVKLVAQRDRHVSVVYVSDGQDGQSVNAIDLQQLMFPVRLAYLRTGSYADITDEVISEMAKDSFLSAIVSESEIG